MKKIKIKAATVARIVALIMALGNQCLALLGKGEWLFANNQIYQMISLIATIVTSVINCWYNQDVTRLARVAGAVFDALKDRTLTEEELSNILEIAKAKEDTTK